MSKIWLVLAVLLAASAVSWGDGGTVKSVQSPTRHYELVPGVVVEIDRVEFAGDSVIYDQNLVLAALRQVAKVTAVAGQSFDDIAATQDRVVDSGRYRQSSREMVRPGKMIAADKHLIVVVSSHWDIRDDFAGVLVRRVVGADAQMTRGTAEVKVTITPVDIKTGLSSQSFVGRGKKSEIIEGSAYVEGNNYNYSDADPETRFLAKALEDATKNAMAALQKSWKDAETIGIEINNNTILRVGDEISFSHGGKEIARYEILEKPDRDGRTSVRQIAGNQRPGPRDDFRVVTR